MYLTNLDKKGEDGVEVVVHPGHADPEESVNNSLAT